MPEVKGTVEAGFEKARDAFAGNFETLGELGAAFSLYVDGKKVVDIWGGVADPATGAPYTEDSLQLVFSTTKGAATICAALLAQRGELDVDAPVAKYWPEFVAAGKADMPVRMILNHQAGLVAFDRKVTRQQIMDVTPVVEALAAQKPLWEPGTNHGYHGLTIGWLLGEIVRRITGKSLGTFFREEVAAPLGLEFWIGLPESEERRVAPLQNAPAPEDPEMIAMMEKVLGPGTLGYRALTVDGALPLDTGAGMLFNSRDIHATEMPAANGITNAHSLARMYAATVSEVDGVRLLDDATVDRFRASQSRGFDQTLQVESHFGLGFMLNGEMTPLLSDASFGHAGAGGSLGFADREARIGFGYVMNQMGGGIAGDPRTITLIDAVRASL